MRITEGRCPFLSSALPAGEYIKEREAISTHCLLMLPGEVYSKNHEDTVSNVWSSSGHPIFSWCIFVSHLLKYSSKRALIALDYI